MSKIYFLSPWCERRYTAPQNSLLYLKYYLADHGYKSKVIDCSHYDRNYVEVIDIIKKEQRPIIGITAYTRESFHASRIIKKIKKMIPGCHIVVGGRHFGFLAEDTLKELPEVDIVVRGEGEITMKEVCDIYYEGKDIKDVLGISYTSEGKILHNNDRPLEDNLDKFRCFSFDDKEELKAQMVIGNSKVDAKRMYFAIMATRGCPNRCVYCSLTAQKVRYRSIGSIINEIEEKIKLTGVRNVTFADSSLTINRKFVKALCAEIMNRGLNIRFNCYSRVNIDPGILEIMKNAGLVSVEIGLESGSPKVLKSIRKNIKVDQFRNFCKMAYNLGVKVYVFCMISLPDEEIEDTNKTIDLIKELSKFIYYVGVQTTRILPDAALYQIASKRDLLPEGFSWFKPYQIPKEYRAISKDMMYDSIPLYLENLQVDEISKKLEEFKFLLDSRLTSFSILKKAVKYNLSGEGIKHLTLKKLPVKSARLISMAYHAYKNRMKEFNYH